MKKARIIGPVLMIMLGLALVASPAQSAVDVGANQPDPCNVGNAAIVEPCYPDPCYDVQDVGRIVDDKCWEDPCYGYETLSEDVTRAHESCVPDPCREQVIRAHERCEPDPCDYQYYASAQVIDDDWCEPDPCDPNPQVDRAIDPCRPSIPPNTNVTTTTTEPRETTTTTEVPEETTTTEVPEETTTTSEVEETTTTDDPADVASDSEGRAPTSTRGGALARTGAESGPLTAGGVALAGLGVALLVVERRRSAARA